MNKPSHIGGFLPIWGIIYLYFVDFDVIENHQSTVDYSLPRITHIKNDDFQYLALVDMNYESKKAFAVLSLRDISQTPYANVGLVNNAPVNPSEFLSVPHVEVINAMNVDLDGNVKPDPHSKKQARVEETTKEEPTIPKVENIVDVKPEEKNRSPPSTPENFSCGINENRSFIMKSSSSRKYRVKCFQGTPIIIEDVSLLFLLQKKTKQHTNVMQVFKFKCPWNFLSNKKLEQAHVLIELKRRIGKREHLKFNLVMLMSFFFKILEEAFLRNILFFPTIKSSNWIYSALVFFSRELTFFYPCGTISETVEGELVHNLENIPKCRMISAFKLFKSTLNQLKEDLPPSF
ncbi:uncharacterized protein LOC123401427 isoform X2 [Hordeum vulgare subsp. vulgare]|uniref:uncharacterized protein LOC123401427 isoform X2 n=1 Tax=Hordeum vulgare subsp. vulgare TaxID=112509 RepID=UPI001D1A40D9|nr:uncharacterized protein LOC123401427 isoform X2 [Hordeum vulgare subsp. vulgare]